MRSKRATFPSAKRTSRRCSTRWRRCCPRRSWRWTSPASRGRSVSGCSPASASTRDHGGHRSGDAGHRAGCDRHDRRPPALAKAQSPRPAAARASPCKASKRVISSSSRAGTLSCRIGQETRAGLGRASAMAGTAWQKPARPTELVFRLPRAGAGVTAPDGCDIDAVGGGKRGRVRDPRPVPGANQAESQRLGHPVSLGPRMGWLL
jgi:hypothetical protein